MPCTHLKTGEPMPKVEYLRNRARDRLTVAALAAICVGAVWFIAWSLLNPADLELMVERSFQQKGVAALPFALLTLPPLLTLIVIHGRRAADDRPLLVLDEQGLFYRDWRTGAIPWEDVLGCQTIEVEESAGKGMTRRKWYLEVRLKDAERFLARRHGGGEFSPAYQRRYFRIPLADVRVERDELLAAVRSRLGR